MTARIVVARLPGAKLRAFLLLLAACGAIGMAAPARAQRVSPMMAGRFVQFCNSPRGGGQQICDAYITGMADSFALVGRLQGNGGDSRTGICVPRAASGQDMRNMVLSWIGSHRDTLHKQVGEVVYAALHDSYPCNGAKAD